MAKKYIGDTPEQIETCLKCDKFKCNDCLDTRYKRTTSRTYGRINERDFFECYDSGYSDSEIALELGVNYNSVREYRKRRDLEKNGGVQGHA